MRGNNEMNVGLKFGFIGLGQAGGNIANEFSKLGYEAIAVNTSSTDLELLKNIHPNKRKMINIGIQGAGKNPEIGREALERNINEIYELIQDVFTDVDKLFVCAGLGGGTGSGMLPLMLELLCEQGLEVSVITTFPSNIESTRVKVVALSAFGEITKINGVTSIFVIDNEKAAKRLPNIGLQKKYEILNRQFSEQLDYVNKLCIEPSLMAFDAKDLEVVLNTRGITIINEVVIENTDELREDLTLANLLKNSIESSVGPSYDEIDAGSAVFLFELPEGQGKYISEKSMELINLKTGNPFDIFYGIYENQKNEKKMGIMTFILSGLSLQDIPRLTKINEEIDSKEKDIEKLFQMQKESYDTKVGGILNRINGKQEIKKTGFQSTNANSVLERLRSKPKK